MMDEDEEADLDQDAEEGTLLRTGDDELPICVFHEIHGVKDVLESMESLEKQANGISQDSEPSPTDDVIKSAVPSLEDGKEIVEGLEKQTSATISQPSDSSPTDDVSIRENERSVADGPINFADFDSAKDLEVCPS
jgi:hypothetical protein